MRLHGWRPPIQPIVERRVLDKLNRDETQGLLAHLIDSIGNGDLKIALLTIFIVVSLMSLIAILTIVALVLLSYLLVFFITIAMFPTLVLYALLFAAGASLP